ncbi:MAG: MASE3 domain-containing protein [Syntrophobacteraceae bacterium]
MQCTDSENDSDGGPSRPHNHQQDDRYLSTATKTTSQVIAGIVLLVGLYALSRYSYLLFHSFVELFTAAVTGTLFLLAWHSRRFSKDDAFVFLGCANLCIGIICILHTLAYKGMGVFVAWPGPNLATQLWIIARFIESLSFLVFSLLIGKQLRPWISMWGCLLVTAILLCSVFVWSVFPTCYLDGVGLTPFKIVSEYVVCFLLAANMVILFRKRRFVDSLVYRLLMGSLCFSFLAGLAFTAYVSVYGLSNLVGHYFHLVTFFLVYQALIRSSLTRPYGTLFRELSAAREAISRREQYYRSVLDHLHEEIRIIDLDGTIVEANRTYLNSSGLSREQVVGQRCLQCDEGCEKAKQCGLSVAFATGKPVSQVHEHRKPDGRTVQEDVLFSPLRDANGSIFQVIAAARDVTARKEMEAQLADSERRLRTLVEEAPISIMTFDVNGTIDFVNQHQLKIFDESRFTKEYYLGRPITELPGLVRSGRARELEPVLHGQPVVLEEVHFPAAAQGFVGYQRIKAVPLLEAETVVGGILLREDITEQRKAMDALQESVEQKVALLREVHHRVKNNLQIVASLLNLQASRSQNPDVLAVLHDMRNRVYSMALLHEALYRSKSLARTNFAGYVEELCTQLLRSVGSETERIELNRRVAPIRLSLEQAVPCGLIINELVSNALKHGFPDGRAGKITVAVQAAGESQIHLSVRDDGVGLPDWLEVANTRTLGLKLVSGLVRQLDGELAFSGGNGHGASFSIVFTAPKEARKESN